METFFNEHLTLFFIVIFAISIAYGLAWQAFMQRIWGGSALKELSNERNFYLKTRQGEFRVDGTHKRFSFKPKKAKTWETVDFDQVRNIHVFSEVNGGALIEFFLGDWGLWDLHGRYRDVINTYKIQITLKDSRDIAVFVLRQYEQREMWLGHYFLQISLGILKRLNLYRNAEEVAQEKLDYLVKAFIGVGFFINVRH